jgi:hypothetical protein
MSDSMKTIYSYDNFDGDKGIIIADSYEEAVEIYKKEYPKRKIADNIDEYYDNGCYIEAEDIYDGKSKLLVTYSW